MVLCFGELLLRLAPDLQGKWLDKNALDIYVGGAELNVAMALAKWNIPVSYCTCLPDNYLTGDILSELKQKNIHTDSVLLSGDRIGTYYLEHGSDLKAGSVIYDRANSSFGQLTTGMFHWDLILQNIDWLHFSAISPALNERVAAVCLELLQAASKKNIKISIDLNYRPKLWKQRNPHDVMSELLPYCDLVMGNIWAAHDLLGIPLDHRLVESNTQADFLQHAKFTSSKILKRFARVKEVACTFRFPENKGVRYFGSLFTENHQVVSSVYQSDYVMDRVGTGDCFMAGLIYGMRRQLPEAEVIGFAAAAGFGKFFEKGDHTQQEVAGIYHTMKQYE